MEVLGVVRFFEVVCAWVVEVFTLKVVVVGIRKLTVLGLDCNLHADRSC